MLYIIRIVHGSKYYLSGNERDYNWQGLINNASLYPARTAAKLVKILLWNIPEHELSIIGLDGKQPYSVQKLIDQYEMIK